MGKTVEYVRLGYAVVLGFTGDCQVVIESDARLDGPAGRADIEPGENPSDAVATLIGEAVRSASVRATGELELCFEGGQHLLVEVLPDVESWAVTGPAGVLIVCMAGGELAVWGDA
ncbi:DUF6188 family protein [Actinoplanes sp. DH11]|uniref:DUF6188 family protein n=1 Tax=Actinoplanes sp. DH11 TaxID=2857011 RepID=UPI001E3E081C|nr:DUF6188 family protein [Actinoplanes sp. DH11]